jgi:hypothetical protein
MSKLTEYTLEIYKKDRRIKRDARYGKDKAGLRFVETQDFAAVTKDFIEYAAQSIRELGFEVQIFETFRTETNMMSGKQYKERYDTPYYCSPSSETYWSM